jgi:hypothetical protein
MRTLLLCSLLAVGCSAPNPGPTITPGLPRAPASPTPNVVKLEKPGEASEIDGQISSGTLKSRGLGGSVMVWSGPDGIRRIDRDAGDTYRFYYTGGQLRAAYASGYWGPIYSKGGASRAQVEQWVTFHPSAAAKEYVHIFNDIRPVPEATVRRIEKLGQALYKRALPLKR